VLVAWIGVGPTGGTTAGRGGGVFSIASDTGGVGLGVGTAGRNTGGGGEETASRGGVETGDAEAIRLGVG
jgi:hypothetical protein